MVRKTCVFRKEGGVGWCWGSTSPCRCARGPNQSKLSKIALRDSIAAAEAKLGKRALIRHFPRNRILICFVPGGPFRFICKQRSPRRRPPQVGWTAIQQMSKTVPSNGTRMKIKSVKDFKEVTMMYVDDVCFLWYVLRPLPGQGL